MFLKIKKTLKIWLSNNWQYMLMFLLMFVNLLSMHLSIAGNSYIKNLFSWVVPIEFVFFDILVSLTLCGVLALLNKKIAYTLVFILTLLWSFSNVAYSRFFGHYLSLSAIGEVVNLDSSMMGSYLGTLFKPSDIIYLITTAVFVLLIHKAPKTKTRPYWYFASAIFVAIFHLALLTVKSGDSFKNCLNDNFGSPVLRQLDIDANYVMFMHGSVRSVFYSSLLENIGNNDLSPEQCADICDFVNSRKRDTIVSTFSRKNMVFILVESLLSVTLDKKIGDFEVTPNLSRLKDSPESVINVNMVQNILDGESSDGQLIYLTGLLPLPNVITVSKILRNDLVSLPELLRDSLGYNTAITIPTLPHFWHQDELNRIYGIDNPFAVKLKGGVSWANDNELFDLALKNVSELKQPFFHLVLTSSMHSPYTDRKDFLPRYDVEFPENYSSEYCHYLEACHYTDSLIGCYFDEMKAKGLYDSTIFVIVSDHEAHQKFLNMESDMLGNLRIPLIIVNSGLSKSQIVDSTINQIDVFPTLLDVFGLDSKWRGVGNSLIDNPDYNAEITDRQKNISELIIKGNYFDKQ